MSSPAFSCAWNGSGSALFNTSIDDATTSTCPVRIFGLIDWRLRTTPVTRRQSSYPMLAAVATTAALPSAPASGSATIWTMPSWSRRSMKHRPPRSRATSAQPHKVTDWPINDSSIRPQKWVRIERNSGAGPARPESPLVYRQGRPEAVRRRRWLGGRRGIAGFGVRFGGGGGSGLRFAGRGRLGFVAEVALLVRVLLEVGL